MANQNQSGTENEKTKIGSTGAKNYPNQQSRDAKKDDRDFEDQKLGSGQDMEEEDDPSIQEKKSYSSDSDKRSH